MCITPNRFSPAVQKLRLAMRMRDLKLIHGTSRVLWARDDDYYEQASWRVQRN